MKNKINHRWGSLAKAGLVIVLFFGVAQGAQAAQSLAADHTIQNSVTVTYDDAAGTGNLLYTATDTIDITVRLVRAVATVTPDAVINDALDSPNLLALGVDSVFFYDIINNSNGIDTVTATSTKTSGVGEATLTLSGTASYTLAGTTLATTTVALPVGAATLAILVPTDATDDASVNGFLEVQLPLKQKLRFSSGEVCDVASAIESELANGTSTITVTNCDIANIVTASAQIGEVLRVSVTVNPSVGGTIFVDTVFTTNDDAADVLLTFTEELLVAAPNLSIVKYVRNVTVPVTGNTCTSNRDCLTIGANNYFSSLITVDPTHTLEYAVLIVNDGNTQAIDVSVADTIDPTLSFVTFLDSDISVVTRALGDNCGAGIATCVVTPTYTNAGDTVATLTTPANTAGLNAANFATSVLTVGSGYDLGTFVAGDGAGALAINPATAPAGGAIEAGEVSVVIFRVLVD